MIVTNDDADAPHMHFDNLTVWSNDPSPADSGLAPTRPHPNGNMVLIPGGEFIMGSYQGDYQRLPHIVAVKSFYIDQTEVTNAAYEQCVAAGKCKRPQDLGSYTRRSYYTDAAYANYPVIYVTWEQARDFCKSVGKRLPTEAEWEKAAGWDAAAGKKTIWPWGNEFLLKRANTDEAQHHDAIAVAQFPEEINHTFDMGGNVAEWTSSLEKPYPYNEQDGREDLQAQENRIFRGGSWAQTTGKARSATWQSAAPTIPFNEIGFRCAAGP
jgi:eukaryotic-like serine/threonine-protein kinase